jgi:hypothetical protein
MWVAQQTPSIDRLTGFDVVHRLMMIRHSIISVRHSGTALGMYEVAAVMQDEP